MATKPDLLLATLQPSPRSGAAIGLDDIKLTVSGLAEEPSLGSDEDQSTMLVNRLGVSGIHARFSLNPVTGEVSIECRSILGIFVDYRGELKIGEKAVLQDKSPIKIGPVVEYIVHNAPITESDYNRCIKHYNFQLGHLPLFGQLNVKVQVHDTKTDAGRIDIILKDGRIKGVDREGNLFSIKKRPEGRDLERIGSHPNLVGHALGLFVRDPKVGGNLMVLEHTTTPLKGKEDIPAHEMLVYVKQILDATVYLHERDVAHGEITAANIWLQTGPTPCVKLGGIGDLKDTRPEENKAFDVQAIGRLILTYSIFKPWFAKYLSNGHWKEYKPLVARPGGIFLALTNIGKEMMEVDKHQSARSFLDRLPPPELALPLQDQQRLSARFLQNQPSVRGTDVIPHLVYGPLAISCKAALELVQKSGTPTTKLVAQLRKEEMITLEDLSEQMQKASDMGTNTAGIYLSLLLTFIQTVHLAQHNPDNVKVLQARPSEEEVRGGCQGEKRKRGGLECGSLQKR